jgi:Ca2+-binding RTX toxin-like protein
MANYVGTAGRDNWVGTADADTANGLDGDDTMRGLGGDDEIDGGAGDDFIFGGADNDLLRGGDDDDFLLGEAGDDIVEGGAGADSLRGDAGNDQLRGGDGNDLLRGGSGVDHFDGGADDGDDPIFGGHGDRVSFFEQAATAGVIADLRTGIISNDGFGNVETMTGIESLGADTQFADTFYGNDLRNAFIVGPGDSVYGFGGDDDFYVQGAPAVLDGGDGNDLLALRSDGGYLIPDGPDADTLADIAAASSAGWTVNLATGTLTAADGSSASFSGIERVRGGHLGDALTGDAGSNELDGFYGDDLLDGGAGADRLTGGWGADTFIVDDPLDEVIEAPGGGIDEVRTALLVAALPQQVENFLGTFAGAGPGQTVSGNSLNNRIIGSAADDVLSGGGGHDALIGGAGSDVLAGGASNDILIGGTLGANLIVNGGFETQDGSNNAQQYIHAGWDGIRGDLIFRKAPSLAGWISHDGTPFELATHNGPAFSSADGNVVLEMEAGAGEELLIHQDIAGLSPGTMMLLTFSVALPPDAVGAPGDPTGLLVFWNNVLVKVVVAESAEMTQYHLLVPAFAVGAGAGGANRLSFMELGDWDGLGTLLDGVSLRAIADDGVSDWAKYDSAADGGNLGVLANLGATPAVLDGVTIFAGRVRDTNGSFDQLNGIDSITVSTSADSWLVGSAAANRLEGGSGNDDIDGGAGADHMAGRLGNDIYLVDNAGDQVVENANEGTDEIRTALGVGATLPQRIANHYQLAANVENLTGTGLGQGLRGNALDNLIVAGSGADFIDLRDGGTDTVVSGDGRDVIYYGAAMDSTDRNDAGAAGGDPRGDLLILQGDYASQLSRELWLNEDALVGVEKLRLLKGSQTDFGDTAGNFYSYTIQTFDGNVAAGEQLVVQAGSLRVGERLDFNGSRELDGSFKVFGGRDSDVIVGGSQGDHLLGRAGDDHLVGGDGDDRLRGGLGKDRLEGNSGADVFVYAGLAGAEGYANAALESTGTDHDVLDGFNAAEDRIDLPGAVTGLTADTSGALSAATFDADLAAALGAFQAGSAVMFTPDGGDLAGRHFLVVDANGDGAYSAPADFVFEIVNPVGPLPASPDIFV